MKPSIHIVSQTKHGSKWEKLLAKGENIISTWFTTPGLLDLTVKEALQLSKDCMHQAMTADYTILYAETHDELRFALVQVGAALASGKFVVIVGHCESISTLLRDHPQCLNNYTTVERALLFINKNTVS